MTPVARPVVSDAERYEAAGHGAGEVRHLYVHLPFCAHRCGYCDFVTAVGRRDEHGAYVDALVLELEQERWRLSADVDTVFVGGGTPTFTEPDALRRVLDALPASGELTVEANPETVTLELADAAARRPRESRLARRAVVQAGAASGARARCRSRRRPTVRSNSP